MNPKSIGLSANVQEYLVAHGAGIDPIAQELIDVTAELGRISGMQIAPEQGAFMTMLTRLLDVRFAVEVGTFTGYSALSIARGLAPGGRLLCCDVSDEWVSLGRPFWERAGVADSIEVGDDFQQGSSQPVAFNGHPSTHRHLTSSETSLRRSIWQ